MSTEPSSAPVISSSGDDLYTQVECYPWDTDEEFQAGLSAILGPSPSPEQAAELALRARCFYFTRKFSTVVDFDSYKAYRASRSLPPLSSQTRTPFPNGTDVTAAGPTSSHSSTAASGGAPTDAPYPTSFQDIVELITSGKPIPGIREIPNTVLEGQGTQSTQSRRKKPWEKDDAPADATTLPGPAPSQEA